MALYLARFTRPNGDERLRVLDRLPLAEDIPAGAVRMDVSLPWPEDQDFVAGDAPSWVREVGFDSGWLQRAPTVL